MLREVFMQIAWGFGAGVGFAVAFTLAKAIGQFVYGMSEGDEEGEK